MHFELGAKKGNKTKKAQESNMETTKQSKWLVKPTVNYQKSISYTRLMLKLYDFEVKLGVIALKWMPYAVVNV